MSTKDQEYRYNSPMSVPAYRNVMVELLRITTKFGNMEINRLQNKPIKDIIIQSGGILLYLRR